MLQVHYVQANKNYLIYCLVNLRHCYKSCTLESRDGNDKPRYWHNDKLSINSMGLPK